MNPRLEIFSQKMLKGVFLKHRHRHILKGNDGRWWLSSRGELNPINEVGNPIFLLLPTTYSHFLGYQLFNFIFQNLLKTIQIIKVSKIKKKIIGLWFCQCGPTITCKAFWQKLPSTTIVRSHVVIKCKHLRFFWVP